MWKYINCSKVGVRRVCICTCYWSVQEIEAFEAAIDELRERRLSVKKKLDDQVRRSWLYTPCCSNVQQVCAVRMWRLVRSGRCW